MTPHLLLINPNSNAATTAMMQDIVQRAAGGRIAIEAVTAPDGPPMITTPAALQAAATGVVEMGRAHGPGCRGIIVGAFGDPGRETLAAAVTVPVAGLCAASMQAAAAGGRRFAVATVTPDLIASIAEAAERLGLAGQFAGTRCSTTDPLALAADPDALTRTLAELTQTAIAEDGAQAVIIGGGPLGQAAEQLAPRFAVPVLAPLTCALEQLLARPDVAG
ncbi:aspartate/glutamate racemase family protein [Azorhizobium oxalatiphilum]|nr:aspartate/glutamate racemase family protein [Azorhizobium oxalatiphilum]